MLRELFLADRHSLMMLRRARRDPSLLLVGAPDVHLRALPERPDLGMLRLVLPEELLPISAENPLELTCFSRDSRSKSACVRSRCLLSRLPEDSFLEVRRADGTSWGGWGKEAVRLFVESPGLSFVRARQRLDALVGDGALSRGAAFFQLLSLAMELCGSYARDPQDPACGTCAFEVVSAGTGDRLRSYLGELADVRGVKGARRIAELVMDGSGSPEETLLALAFRLPFEQGGIASPPLVLNEPIAWPQEVAGLVEHRQMRPDIRFPGYATAAEYNGLTHMDRRSFEEDQRRIRDYQLCGISVFPATYQDVRSARALAAYLLRVAHSIDLHGLPGYERSVRAALADEGASYMRRVLLSQLLPAVPSERVGR